VVGFLEVVPKIRKFLQFAREAERIFQEGTVDAVVLVDFPGFNWHIARRAKKYGIPVYYYCPPQLWAWGGWRIRKMRQLVDHVLAVLPIEQNYFSDNQVPSVYVGHPFFDAVEQSVPDAKLISRFEQVKASGSRLVAVLPGSRNNEVSQNWPIMLASIRQLHRQHPEAKFLVACYRQKQRDRCRESLLDSDRHLPIEFFVERTSEVIESSECAMMVSGCVSLELMARRTPAVVVYRVGRVTHAIAKRLVHLDSFTLPNLMGEQMVYPEVISVGNTDPAVKVISDTVDRFLADDAYRARTVQTLEELSARFARPGASQRAAEWIVEAVAVNRKIRPDQAKICRSVA
jgi:lipid-A-disaccharide synthase